MCWKKIICSSFLLAGCVHVPESSYVVKKWSHDQQQEILTEEKKLPAGNILITVLLDYTKTRRELEACHDDTD